MKEIIKVVGVGIVLVGLMTACMYKMPTEEDFSTMPTTNNPNVTREPTEDLMMPKINY